MKNKLARVLCAPLLAAALGSSVSAQAQLDDYDSYYWNDYYYDDVYDDYGWDYDWWDGWAYETPYGEWQYKDGYGGGEWVFDDDWW